MSLISVAAAIQDEHLREQAAKALGQLPEKSVSVSNLEPEPGQLQDMVAAASPDVLIVDLASLGERFGDCIRELRSSSNKPEIVGLHTAAEAGVIVEAIRAGAREFLYERIDDTLAQTVGAIRTEVLANGARSRRTGKLLAFFSAKGGCGLSTVAAHSAAALRRDPKCSVLLADLNLKAASAAFLMHVNPRHTLDSALSSIHRMDATLWSAIVTTTEQGVALAPPPAEHVHASRDDSSGLHALMQFWKTQYDYTVVDCGAGTGHLALTLVEQADEVVLVTSTDVVALQHARRMIQRLTTLQREDGRVRLVLNRVPRKQSLRNSELEKLLQHPVFAAIPNDYESLNEAWEAGRLLSAEHPVNLQIQSLVSRLTGAAVPERKKRFRLFN